MSETKVYTALGLMSGTSLDGVDAAILRTDGERILGFGPTSSLEYDHEDLVLKMSVSAALEWNFKGPPPNGFEAGSNYIDNKHAEVIYGLDFDVFDIDLIGYHGQTVLHLPAKDGKKGQTLQLGNGQVLADEFGIPCVYDFRTADVEAGGQGAPLAPIYHKALVEYAGLDGITAVLNLGGVGNVTLVGPDILKATDTGPANGPLDSWVQLKGHKYDPGGDISRDGAVDFARVESWLSADFFSRPTPRSADRYDFDVIPDMRDMSLKDGAATLCAFTVLSVKKSLAQLGPKPERVIVCGGGRHNQTIMTMLSVELNRPVMPAEYVGWDSDMIEAQAFAYLAVRSKLGLQISFPETTGVPKPMTGGRLVNPQ